MGFFKSQLRTAFIGECDENKVACVKKIHAHFGHGCGIHYKDISKRDVSRIPDIDVYLAGFPCPSFSRAGQRKGVEDSRGKIMYDVVETLMHLYNKFSLKV